MKHILKAYLARLKRWWSDKRSRPLPPCKSWQEARERVYNRTGRHKPPQFPVVRRKPRKERRSKRLQAKLVTAAERKREKRLDK